jgi:hypothetical protein
MGDAAGRKRISAAYSLGEAAIGVGMLAGGGPDRRFFRARFVAEPSGSAVGR